MSAPLCGIGYERPDHSLVKCTYLAGHPDPAVRCSWFGVKAQDDYDQDHRTGPLDYTPAAVQAMLDAVMEGTLDPYIEAILAAGHTRKRMLRGDRGFVRLTPTEEGKDGRS